MKILAIADRAPRKSIAMLVAENAIDIICTLGDLELSALRELRDITTIPKIGVYGNHCSGRYFEELGVRNMHLKTFEYKGVTFGGFEGSVRYKESAYAKMYTQEEASELLWDFPRVDVLITHAPPFGINDEMDSASHQGFKALRAYVEEKEPGYLLHGHTYPTQESIVDRCGQTTIVYVYGDKIIEV